MCLVLTGDELRDAREQAGLTQQQLGDQLGKAMRSVGNWERAPRLPDSAERLVRRAFPEWFGAPAAPLASVSDAQLLAEIARRFDRGREAGEDGGDTAPKTRAGQARTTWQDHITGDQVDLAADTGPGQPGHDTQDPQEQRRR